VSDPDHSDNVPSPSTRRRSGTGVALVVAVGVVLVLSMALVAFYASYVADTNRQNIVALQTQLHELSGNEQLIAAQLASQGSASPTAAAPTGKASAAALASKAATGTAPYAPVQVAPPASGQPKVTAEQAAQGIRVVLGKVVKAGALAGSGVAITFKPGGYYEGSIAFSVAASHGDVLKGSYYVDGTSTRTIDAHILSGADVSVYGWNGSAASKSASIHTADLAKVIGGAAAKDPWKSAWYWFEIGPGMAIVKVMQLPRP
jgi:hypothetical protein